MMNTVLRILSWICALVLSGATIVFAQEAPPVALAPGEASLAAASSPDLTFDELELYVLPLNHDQLAELAETWQAHLQNILEDGVVLGVELQSADADRAAAIRDEIVSVTQKELQVQEKYQVVLDAWRGKGAKAEEIEPHDAFQQALAADILRSSDPSTVFQIGWAWLTSADGGLLFLVSLLALLGGAVLVFLIAAFARRMADRGLRHVGFMAQSLKHFLLATVYWGVVAAGVLVILVVMGVSVTPVLALLGGVGIIVGLALQETLGNVASGLTVVFFKPFDIGDWVRVAGTEGTVKEINIYATKIRRFDNTLVVVPNSKVWGAPIDNVEANRMRRVDIELSLDLSNSFEGVRETLLGVATAYPDSLAKPEPSVYVSELNETAMTVVLWVWVKTEDHWTAFKELSAAVQASLADARLAVPARRAVVDISDATAT